MIWKVGHPNPYHCSIQYNIWLGSCRASSKEILYFFVSILSTNLISINLMVTWSPVALPQGLVSGWFHDCVRLQNGSLGFCLPWCLPELWESQAENEWTLDISFVPSKMFRSLWVKGQILDINCYIIGLCLENHWSQIHRYHWTSLVVQWLRLHASTAGGTGSIPGWGSSTCCTVQPKRKKKSSIISVNNWHFLSTFSIAGTAVGAKDNQDDKDMMPLIRVLTMYMAGQVVS